jgi:hypothetical protein
MKNRPLIIISVLFIISVQGCITYGEPPTKKEIIPVDWGHYSSERIWSQVIDLMNQNIRHYDYFIYTHSINEKSDESAWNNEIIILTYTNGEIITMAFNYFSIYLYYSNNRDFMVNGIPAQFATIRGSASDFNSTLNRISLSLRNKQFYNDDKLDTDLYWLTNLRLRIVSADE